MAARAFVEPLAGVDGHLLGLRVLAHGAGEHGGQGGGLGRGHKSFKLQHVNDVEGAGGIVKQQLLELVRRQLRVHGHSEEVDDFLGVGDPAGGR